MGESADHEPARPAGARDPQSLDRVDHVIDHFHFTHRGQRYSDVAVDRFGLLDPGERQHQFVAVPAQLCHVDLLDSDHGPTHLNLRGTVEPTTFPKRDIPPPHVRCPLSPGWRRCQAPLPRIRRRAA